MDESRSKRGESVQIQLMEDQQEGKEGNLMNGRKRQFDKRLV
jgi:hypothetical protein